MTTPAQPATGSDPAPATGDPSQQTPDPSPTGNPAPPQPATGDDWATAFEGMTPDQVKRQLDHARTWERRAKDNKKALDELKAQAPSDGEPTIDDYKARAEAAEDRAAELAYVNTVSRIAGNVDADAEALLDSDSFRNAVADELGDDFDDEDLRVAVERVAKEFAKKPRFSSRPAAPGRSGGDFTGSPGSPAPIDQQIAEAESKRDFATAIALKRHRAALKQ